MDEKKQSEAWRVFRIQSELVAGIETLAKLGCAVSVYGSARLDHDNRYYQEGLQVGKLLASQGLAVITGGGPGIMEAVNRGAFPEQGCSVGLNISLLENESSNSYQDVSVTFRYFFVRKFMFVKHAVGFVILPGGYGTLDELFEALTLVQTKKVNPFPIVLIGKSYWQGLLAWMQGTMLGAGCIDADDLSLLQIVDTAEEAVAIINRYRATFIDGPL